MDPSDTIVLDDEDLRLLEELAKLDGLTPEKEAEKLFDNFCGLGG